jgi:hypothetical protein
VPGSIFIAVTGTRKRKTLLLPVILYQVGWEIFDWLSWGQSISLDQLQWLEGWMSCHFCTICHVSISGAHEGRDEGKIPFLSTLERVRRRWLNLDFTPLKGKKRESPSVVAWWPCGICCKHHSQLGQQLPITLRRDVGTALALLILAPPLLKLEAQCVVALGVCSNVALAKASVSFSVPHT